MSEPLASCDDDDDDDDSCTSKLITTCDGCMRKRIVRRRIVSMNIIFELKRLRWGIVLCLFIMLLVLGGSNAAVGLLLLTDIHERGLLRGKI